jgi:hypothetical protein
MSRREEVELAETRLRSAGAEIDVLVAGGRQTGVADDAENLPDEHRVEAACVVDVRGRRVRKVRRVEEADRRISVTRPKLIVGTSC